MPAMPRRRVARANSACGASGWASASASPSVEGGDHRLVVVLDRRRRRRAARGRSRRRNPGPVRGGRLRRVRRAASRSPARSAFHAAALRTAARCSSGRPSTSGRARSAHEPTSNAVPEFASLVNADDDADRGLAVVGTLGVERPAHRRPEVVELAHQRAVATRARRGPRAPRRPARRTRRSARRAVDAKPRDRPGRRGGRARTGAASRAGGSGSSPSAASSAVSIDFATRLPISSITSQVSMPSPVTTAVGIGRREAAREHAEPREHALLGFREQ